MHYTVWECKEWEKHLIMKDIVEYVLSRHLSITKEKIIPIAGQLDFTLLQKDLGMAINFFLIFESLFPLLFLVFKSAVQLKQMYKF